MSLARSSSTIYSESGDQSDVSWDLQLLLEKTATVPVAPKATVGLSLLEDDLQLLIDYPVGRKLMGCLRRYIHSIAMILRTLLLY
jgi:hypothetical protein